MTESQVEAREGTRRPRRWRYLIDIVVLVAVTFLLDALLAAFIPVPINLERGFVFDAIGKMLLVGVAWGLIRLRGERLADIGLKRPANWMRTFAIGIGFAAIVFIAIYLSEKAGFRRDLSKFKDVQGNLELAALGVFYASIGAGFYEEFMFRGFLMQVWPCFSAQAAVRGSQRALCKARFSEQRMPTRIRLASRLRAHWAF
jgi:membrane protease YdiL (CAAX protease family)